MRGEFGEPESAPAHPALRSFPDVQTAATPPRIYIYFYVHLYTELQNVNLFTQIISVQLNHCQDKYQVWWGIFLGCAYKTQHFQFYPNIHAKHFGGGNIFLGCVKKPTFSLLS